MYNLKNSNGKYSTTKIGLFILIILFLLFALSNCKDKQTDEGPKYEEVMKQAYIFQIQVLALENEKTIEEIKSEFYLQDFDIEVLYRDGLHKYIIKDIFNTYEDATKFKDALGIEDAFLICYDENFNLVEITDEVIK